MPFLLKKKNFFFCLFNQWIHLGENYFYWGFGHWLDYMHFNYCLIFWLQVQKYNQVTDSKTRRAWGATSLHCWPRARARVLWPWRWPELDVLEPLFSPTVSCLWIWLQAPSSWPAYSPRIQEERWASWLSRSGKNPREALLLAQVGSCAFPWTNGCGQGNKWLWLARFWVMCPKPAVRGRRSIERGVLVSICMQLTEAQRLSSSLMAPCRTDTNIIPIQTVVQNRVEQPRYPWLLIQPVCVNARAWTQVCKRVSSTLRSTEDLWFINIYNLSERNLCQTAGLLSRLSSFLAAWCPSIRQPKQKRKEANTFVLPLK